VADFPGGIPECGTDALRFALVAYTSQGRDINLDIARVVGYRHWCNKLWNALRFAMMNLGPDFAPMVAPAVASFPLRARWMLSRLNAAVGTVDACMEKYDFAGATTAIYAFWQYEVCDVYIELVKPVSSSTVLGAEEKRATLEALYIALETGLRMLHPFMPFLTEELWQRLPRSPSVPAEVRTIMLAPYPTHNPAWVDAQAESDMTQSLDVVRAARSLRAAYGLLPRARPSMHVHARSDASADAVARTLMEIRALAGAEAVTVVRSAEEVPAGCAMELVSDALSVYVNLKGAVDAKQEVEKLVKKIGVAERSRDSLLKQQAAADYEAKVPEKQRNANADKLLKLEAEIAEAQRGMAEFTALLS
jgi:valyl-tRNA synthetase